MGPEESLLALGPPNAPEEAVLARLRDAPREGHVHGVEHAEVRPPGRVEQEVLRVHDVAPAEAGRGADAQRRGKVLRHREEHLKKHGERVSDQNILKTHTYVVKNTSNNLRDSTACRKHS